MFFSARTEDNCLYGIEIINNNNNNNNNELGRRLSARSGETRETQFLFQRFSIAIQRFNSICFHGSFLEEAISDHDT